VKITDRPQAIVCACGGRRLDQPCFFRLSSAKFSGVHFLLSAVVAVVATSRLALDSIHQSVSTMASYSNQHNTAAPTPTEHTDHASAGHLAVKKQELQVRLAALRGETNNQSIEHMMTNVSLTRYVALVRAPRV